MKMEVLAQQNNNILAYHAHQVKERPYEPRNDKNIEDTPFSDWDLFSADLNPGTVRSLALRLESALRSAKKTYLDCGQVLLPPHLLSRISADILRMAEAEPCGLRGAQILLHFHDCTNKEIDIGQIRGDPHQVATFQLHLTLKEEEAPWYTRLPKILTNWGKGRTLIVSEGYTLAKRKLYRQ